LFLSGLSVEHLLTEKLVRAYCVVPWLYHKQKKNPQKLEKLKKSLITKTCQKLDKLKNALIK
jgi:hypothetical protein